MRPKRSELTLKEKVFIVKKFYQLNDVVEVQETVENRFKKKLNESVQTTILKIVKAFESTGHVNSHYFYDGGADESDPEADLPPVAKEKATKTAKEVEIELRVVKASVEGDAAKAAGEPEEIYEIFEVTAGQAQEEEEDEAVVPEEEQVLEEDDPNYVPEDSIEEEEEPSSSPGKKTSSSSSASRKKRVACRYCQKVFCGRYLYAHYSKVHSKEPKYICPTCKATFFTFADFKAHRSEHAQTKLECQYCHKVLPNTSTFNRHVKGHLGVRDHVCDVCGKGFQEASTLKLHMRSHTGERPHKCKTCAKGFISVASLRVHERVHTGEKPYKCNYCDKAFSDSSTRNVRRP